MQAFKIFTQGSLIQQRYQVHEIIGRGGSGIVYKALDKTIRRWVAIKQIVYEDANYARFIPEARILGGLNHAGLPQVFDCFVEQAMFFVVMELIEGDTLADLVTRQGAPLGLEQALQWINDLGMIIEYLHQQKPPIIHRDIKPQNIKITASGNLVLLDFGLAQGSSQVTANSTIDEVVNGFSPNYAALEQRNGGQVDQRSDLYALAATFYYGLAGVAPVDSLERAVAVAAGVTDPLIPLATHQPTIPGHIDQAFEQALALNPALRPASIGDFKRQLLASPLVLPRQRRWPVGLALRLIVLIGLLVIAYTIIDLNRIASNQSTELEQALPSTPRALASLDQDAATPTTPKPTMLPASQLVDPTILQTQAAQLRAEAAQWTQIFSDTFELNRNNWSLTTTIDDYANSTLSMQAGKLIFDVTSNTPSGSIAWNLQPTMPYVEDFALSVDMTCVVCEPTTELGLVFRKSGLLNAETFYFLLYRFDQRVRIVKQVPYDALRVGWDVAPSIDQRKNMTHHIELIVKGDQMAVFINDRYALKVEDSTYSSGYPHLAVYIRGATTEQVSFDNLYLSVPTDQVNRTKR
ncbi:serine/threonine protein kinase [Herpetosiphon llansteffanensis]|uniref:serine/threonine protein kinase n=1 Tax=Herpetosiphon llansteffanensis TaxID=2094568 RepID=UPI000D7B94F5|nr:serine/threonine-protein kinase [Herpetosiphon llansteffanensis]